MDSPDTFAAHVGRAAVLLLLGAAVLAGCASQGTRPAFPETPTSAPCPNPEGDYCVGALKPDKVYTTQVITPTISYRVPAKGWFNYEDTPGNFLLVPPGNTLPDVDTGASDYLGVYSVIAPAEFVRPPECVPVFVPGIAPTPAGMAAWLRRNPVVASTRPVAATVGGLHGLVVDLRVKPGALLPRCRNGLTFFSAEVLFRGLPPSTVTHGLVRGMSMRLYLLAYDDRVLAVELVDTEVGPGDLQTLSDVVEHITFSQ